MSSTLIVDTLFLRDIPSIPMFKEAVGAIPTSNSNGRNHYNSGVLIFNTEEFQKKRNSFSFLKGTLGNWLPSSVDEQAFNHYWSSNLATLGVELNWRPKWGYRDDVAVVHFHGFKANVVQFIEGDMRGISRSVKRDYVYELARESAHAVCVVQQYLERADQNGLLESAWLKGILGQLTAAISPEYLVSKQLESVANLVGGAEAGLKLAEMLEDQVHSIRHSVFIGRRRQTIKQLRIHPCGRLGFGSLEIHADSGILSQLKTMPNTTLALGEVLIISQDVHRMLWSAIGLDCHLIVKSADQSDLGEITKIVIKSSPTTLCHVAAVYSDDSEEVIFTTIS